MEDVHTLTRWADLPRPQRLRTLRVISSKAKAIRKRKREAVTAAPSSVPYDFTDLVGEQAQVDQSLNIRDLTIDWIPFWRWYPTAKVFDPTLIVPTGQVQFMDLLKSGTVKAEKINNEWCMGFFRCTRHRANVHWV